MSLTMANMRSGIVRMGYTSVKPAAFIPLGSPIHSPVMAEKSIGVCLLGCGVVGGGVQKILREQRELLRRRTGINFDLVHVAVKDRGDYPTDHEKLPMTLDANAAIDDP